MRPAFALAAALLAAAFAPLAAHAQDTTQVVTAARIAAVAERAARPLASDPDRTLAPAFALADQQVPAGTVVLESGTPQVTSTFVGVPVAIRVDGRVARTVLAGYRVTAYVRTAVAARDLPPGTLLADGDLVLARVPAQGRAAVAPAALVGRRLTASAPHGAVLGLEQTVPNQVVRAGDAAILIVHDGPVALTADVVARTAGALGDTVTVFNPQTHKQLAGIVTGPDRVELELAEAR